MQESETTKLNRTSIALFKRASKGTGDYETISQLCDMALSYLDLRDRVMKDAAKKRGIKWP